ncbi:hypothetical protein [Haloactinopolyspora alba]|nr:hypothetical protein [Haloactinopolyspora alba]
MTTRNWLVYPSLPAAEYGNVSRTRSVRPTADPSAINRRMLDDVERNHYRSGLGHSTRRAPSGPPAARTDTSRRTIPASVIADAGRHVDELARDLGNPLVTTAITGNSRDVRDACDLVRAGIERYGPHAAPAHLHNLAAGLYELRSALALNLARAAGCIDPDRLSEQLRHAHRPHRRRRTR